MARRTASTSGRTRPTWPPNKYITSTSELLALPGFGRDRYLKLAPYITALPPDVKLNVCTASGPVLDAFIGRQSAHTSAWMRMRWQKNRASAGGCFPKTEHRLRERLREQGDLHAGAGRSSSETSSYFRLTSHVTIGTTEFNLYSLLYQEGTGNVRPIQRSFAPD